MTSFDLSLTRVLSSNVVPLSKPHKQTEAYLEILNKGWLFCPFFLILFENHSFHAKAKEDVETLQKIIDNAFVGNIFQIPFAGKKLSRIQRFSINTVTL